MKSSYVCYMYAVKYEYYIQNVQIFSDDESTRERKDVART